MSPRNTPPRNFTLRLCAISLLAALSACASVSASQVVGVSASLKAGLVATEFGGILSESEQNRAAQAEYRALEAGQTGLPVTWKASDKVGGTVVPQQPYAVGTTNCRRYTHVVVADGVSKSATGTACRNSDGAWEPLV